jgi:hypothetical protein
MVARGVDTMMRICFFILFLFSFLAGFSQPTTQSVPNGTYNAVVVTPAGTDTFNVNGIFNDLNSQYTGADITAGMILWDTDRNRFKVLSTTNGATLQLVVLDLNGAGMVASGVGCIMEETNNYSVQVPGISEELQGAIDNHFKQVLATNTPLFNRDTITQNSHGFTVPTEGFIPVRNNGSSWVAANTAAANNLHESFVVEVIDTNTFVLMESGLLFVNSHGLMVGSNYYLQNDGSIGSSPDTAYFDWLATIYADNSIALKAGRFSSGSTGTGSGSGSDNISFGVVDTVLQITDGAGSLEVPLSQINYDWKEQEFFNTTGMTLNITSGTPSNDPAEIFLFRNGMQQKPGVGNDYQISGTTITLSTAATTSEYFRVVFREK